MHKTLSLTIKCCGLHFFFIFWFAFLKFYVVAVYVSNCVLFGVLFIEGHAVRITRHDVLKMPVYSIPVTLAEVLEVAGTALNDSELWALLYATSQSLSLLFKQGITLFVNQVSDPVRLIGLLLCFRLCMHVWTICFERKDL